MPAVVGPIGVDHPQLSHGGVPVLGAEVVPAEAQVVQIHSQAEVGHHLLQGRLVHVPEAGEGSHGLGNLIGHGQGLEGLQRGLPGFHGVNEVLFDGCHVLGSQVAGELIDPGGADQRPVPLGENLNALGGGVCPLVKLAGKVLHGKDDAPLGQLFGDQVQLGLRQDGVHAVLEQLRRDVFHVVAIVQPQAFQRLDPQQGANVPQQRVRLCGKPGPFFYINPIYHCDTSSSFYFPASLARRARAPMSLRQ